jgi:hypothetical protein
MSSALQAVHHSRDQNNLYLAEAAHILFRYRLLDIASDMLGVPRQQWVARPQTMCPKYSVRRLDKVSSPVSLCTSVICSLRGRYSHPSATGLTYSINSITYIKHNCGNMRTPDSAKLLQIQNNVIFKLVYGASIKHTSPNCLGITSESCSMCMLLYFVCGGSVQ